jgi:hypothetical protein
VEVMHRLAARGRHARRAHDVFEGMPSISS